MGVWDVGRGPQGSLQPAPVWPRPNLWGRHSPGRVVLPPVSASRPPPPPGALSGQGRAGCFPGSLSPVSTTAQQHPRPQGGWRAEVVRAMVPTASGCKDACGMGERCSEGPHCTCCPELPDTRGDGEHVLTHTIQPRGHFKGRWQGTGAHPGRELAGGD